MIKYSTIRHDLCELWGLTITDYMVLDLINIWCHNIRYGGWCIASRTNMAEAIRVNERHLQRTIQKLVSLNLIERNDAHFLRTTDIFRDAESQTGCTNSTPMGVSTVHPPCINSTPQGCTNSTPNIISNITVDNTDNIKGQNHKKSVAFAPSGEEKKETKPEKEKAPPSSARPPP